MIFGQLDGIVYLCEMIKTKILEKARMGTIDFGKEPSPECLGDLLDEVSRVYVVGVEGSETQQETGEFEITIHVKATHLNYLAFVELLEKSVLSRGGAAGSSPGS